METKIGRRRPWFALGAMLCFAMSLIMAMLPGAMAAAEPDYYNLFGLGIAGILLLVAVILALVWMFGGQTVGSAKKMVGVIAIILFLCGGAFLAIGYIEPAPAEIVPSAVYDISCGESEAELTVMEDEREINWAITYNTTSNAFASNTGVGTLNFTVSWAEGPDGSVRCSIGAVPSVDISGAASEDVVDMYDSDSYNAYWSKLNAAETAQVHEYEAITLYMEEGDSKWANCVITLNADAFAAKTSANELESWHMPIYIGSEVWTVNFVLYDVLT